jgi:hypothetical protein
MTQYNRDARGVNSVAWKNPETPLATPVRKMIIGFQAFFG